MTCRSDFWNDLNAAVNAILKETESPPEEFTISVDDVNLIGLTICVASNEGTLWYGKVDADGFALMIRSDVILSFKSKP